MNDKSASMLKSTNNKKQNELNKSNTASEKPQYVLLSDYIELKNSLNKKKDQLKQFKDLINLFKENIESLENKLETTKKMYNDVSRINESMKKISLELEELKREREKDKEIEKIREEEREKEREFERKREREREAERIKEKEKEMERKLEREIEREKEKERQFEREIEKAKEKEREAERIKEKEKEFEKEKEIQSLKEKESKLQAVINNLNNSASNFHAINNKKENDFTSSKSMEKLKNKLDFNNINNKDSLFKKLEEMELAYRESIKSFGLLLKKYNTLHEDYIFIKEDYNKLNKRRNEEVINYKSDNEKKEKLIERLRETESSILESHIKSILLNTKRTEKEIGSIAAATNQNINPKRVEEVHYIMTEPLPSFVKFIANARRGGNTNFIPSNLNTPNLS